MYRPGPLTLIMSLLNVLKYLFFIRRLSSMNVYKFLLCRIVSACAIPIILYCSPIIFHGLLNKNSLLLKMHTSAITFQRCSLHTYMCKVQHFKSCTSLSTSIINDPLHPLHPCLSKALSTSANKTKASRTLCMPADI